MKVALLLKLRLFYIFPLENLFCFLRNGLAALLDLQDCCGGLCLGQGLPPVPLLSTLPFEVKESI